MSKNKVPMIPGKFNGQNKGIALRLYNVLLAVPEIREEGRLLCHKIASDYMADIGNALANSKDDDEIKVKVGKTNKDGASNHSFRMVARDIKTAAGTIAQIVCAIDELESNKAIVKRFFPPHDCLPQGVQDYIEDAVKFINESWEEVDKLPDKTPAPAPANA